VDKIPANLRLSHGSAHTIIHNDLKFKEVCAKWVPRELKTEHKEKKLGGVAHQAAGTGTQGSWDDFKTYSNRR
jgi:hypothetical protein